MNQLWISSSRVDLATISTSVEAVRRGAIDAGRDPDRLRYVCRGVVKVRTDVFNQNNELVATFRRAVLVPRRNQQG